LIGTTGAAIGDGNQNTIDILNSGCTLLLTAASICANLTLGGYSDWFLPSTDELNEMYITIGEGSALGNVGGFAHVYYWSSTEKDVWLGGNQWEAQVQTFYNGGINDMDKQGLGGNRFRAVRAF